MKPSLAETLCGEGIIVESIRLLEGVEHYRNGSMDTVSDWRLDSDFFTLGLGHAKPEKVAVVVAQGASIVADAVERLVGSGARKVVRIGTTGGLQPEMRVGDVVLATAAVRNEGTSGHYLRPGVPALSCLRLLHDIRAEIGGRATVHEGIVWTTDGRWVESDEDLAYYSRLDVKSVDMETAALYSSAIVRRIDAVSISVVSDVPIQESGSEFKGINNDRSAWENVSEVANMLFNTVIAVYARHQPRIA